MAKQNNRPLLTFFALIFILWLIQQGCIKNTPTSPLIQTTTQATFQQDIQSNPLVLIDFWAPWCGPCRAMTPDLNKIAKQYKGRVKIYKLNIDDHPQIATAYAVEAIPTIMLFKNGKELNRTQGKQTAKQIAKQIANRLNQ